MPDRNGSCTNSIATGPSTSRLQHDEPNQPNNLGDTQSAEHTNEEKYDRRPMDKFTEDQSAWENGYFQPESGVSAVRPRMSSRDLPEAKPNGQDANGEEDQHMINPLHLSLRILPDRGRGVFATQMIPAGTLIEESPVLVMTAEQWDLGNLQETVLGEYAFTWSGRGQALGLGLASLFNHSSTPNVNFIRQSSSRTIRFTASRRIQIGEELCICYSADESKLWFTPSGRPSMVNSRRGSNAASDTASENDIFAALSAAELFETEDAEQREAAMRRREARKAEIELLCRDRDQSQSSNSASNGKPVRRLRKGSYRKSDSDRGTGSQSPVSRSGSESPSSSSSSYPIYPSVPDRPPPNLPAPLHSLPAPSDASSSDTAELCPDLDWNLDDWVTPKGMEPAISTALPGWIELKRVKGPAELEEDAINEGMMDVWVAVVDDPKTVRLALDFTKERLPHDPAMRHLKRVAKRPHPITGAQATMVALCSTSESTEMDLRTNLASFHSELAGIVPFVHSVPSSPARTVDQLRLRAPAWPVAYAPGAVKPGDSSEWSMARKAWVYAGIKRIILLAREAKAAGELPVGVFVASPPEPFWPTGEGFIPPTPFLRAGACDTRQSTSHPLKHAALNCIRHIAQLRTQPPFSEMQPTRNGADYLLTSLSLFITHEPCVMCCMALLHSRVREVFYMYPRKRGGGFENAFGVHGRKDLNHRFEVWRWLGNEEEGEGLAIDDGVAL